MRANAGDNHRAGAGVRADYRADGADNERALVGALLHLLRDGLGVLRGVAVADKKQLVLGLDYPFAGAVHQIFDGLGPAAGFSNGNQLALVVHNNYRLDVKHRPHKG